MSKNLVNNIFVKKPGKTVDTVRRSSIESQQHGSVQWIDIQDPTRSDLSEYADRFGLHTIHITQALDNGQVAQLSTEDSYIFLLLHMPYFIPKENKIATTEVGIFLGKDYLLTVHDPHAYAVRRLFDEYREINGRETKTAARILMHLIGSLLEEIKNMTQKVSLELDTIEDNVFGSVESDALQIGQLRQKIIRLRRILAVQKNLLEDLDSVIDKFSGEQIRRYYASNTNISRKLWETIEEARETVEIYKDADFTTSTERTNEILAVLTILFTLAIPATILGTFFGMNVLLPGGVETGPWQFLGKYTTALLILAASVLPGLLMFVYFKKNKWF